MAMEAANRRPVKRFVNVQKATIRRMKIKYSVSKIRRMFATVLPAMAAEIVSIIITRPNVNVWQVMKVATIQNV